MQHKQTSMINLNPAYLWFILLCLTSTTHAFNWALYPACAQPQLQANAPAQCDTNNVQGVACLCGSKAFLSGSAKDIWQNCGCDTLKTSASVAASICSTWGAQMVLSQTDMIAAGDGGTSVCVNPGVSSSVASTVTQTYNPAATSVAGVSSSVVSTVTQTYNPIATSAAASGTFSTGQSSSTGSTSSGSTDNTTAMPTSTITIISVVVVAAVLLTVFVGLVVWQKKKKEKKQSSRADDNQSQVLGYGDHEQEASRQLVASWREKQSHIQQKSSPSIVESRVSAAQSAAYHAKTHTSVYSASYRG